MMLEHDEAVMHLVEEGFNEYVFKKQTHLQLMRVVESTEEFGSNYLSLARELFPIYSNLSENDLNKLAKHGEKLDRYLARQAFKHIIPKLLIVGFVASIATAVILVKGVGLGLAIIFFSILGLAEATFFLCPIGKLSELKVLISGLPAWLTRDLKLLYYRRRLKMLGVDPGRCLEEKTS